jgi:hypothetical protein
MTPTQLDINQIHIPSAPGELLDKLTILELKKEFVKDPAKLANITYELESLLHTKEAHIPQTPQIDALYNDLKKTNHKLWIIEDDIRDCERKKQFDQTFIDLARAVYITNDRRCEIKREINDFLGSRIIEEKSYQPY